MIAVATIPLVTIAVGWLAVGFFGFCYEELLDEFDLLDIALMVLYWPVMVVMMAMIAIVFLMIAIVFLALAPIGYFFRRWWRYRQRLQTQ